MFSLEKLNCFGHLSLKETFSERSFIDRVNDCFTIFDGKCTGDTHVNQYGISDFVIFFLSLMLLLSNPLLNLTGLGLLCNTLIGFIPLSFTLLAGLSTLYLNISDEDNDFFDNLSPKVREVIKTLLIPFYLLGNFLNTIYLNAYKFVKSCLSVALTIASLPMVFAVHMVVKIVNKVSSSKEEELLSDSDSDSDFDSEYFSKTVGSNSRRVLRSARREAVIPQSLEGGKRQINTLEPR